MFTAALLIIAKIWKQPQSPSIDKLVKMFYIYIYMYIQTMEYCLTVKNGSLPFVTAYMDLEGTMLSEISQIEKDKYCMI